MTAPGPHVFNYRDTNNRTDSGGGPMIDRTRDTERR